MPKIEIHEGDCFVPLARDSQLHNYFEGIVYRQPRSGCINDSMQLIYMISAGAEAN